MTKKTVIALDGPSGSGKSSTARGVAQALGLAYLDTGAMYRAATWAVLSAGVDVYDEDAVAEHVSSLSILSGTDPASPTIAVSGQDVSEPIRGDDVTGHVSYVAKVPAVRERLVDLQRQAIAGSSGIVVEGRDIGTVVAPDATLKVYLVADVDARAERRAAEMAGEVGATAESLQARDEIDSTRKASPLTQAGDAIVVDSTYLSLDEVIEQVCQLLAERQES